MNRTRLTSTDCLQAKCCHPTNPPRQRKHSSYQRQPTRNSVSKPPLRNLFMRRRCPRWGTPHLQDMRLDLAHCKRDLELEVSSLSCYAKFCLEAGANLRPVPPGMRHLSGPDTILRTQQLSLFICAAPIIIGGDHLLHSRGLKWTHCYCGRVLQTEDRLCPVCNKGTHDLNKVLRERRGKGVWVQGVLDRSDREV